MARKVSKKKFNELVNNEVVTNVTAASDTIDGELSLQTLEKYAEEGIITDVSAFIK